SKGPDETEQEDARDDRADGETPGVGRVLRRGTRGSSGPVEDRERPDEDEPRDETAADPPFGCGLGFYATQSHNAHCVTKTPSSSELTATIAVCARGLRPPIQASARKNAKPTSPTRGRESKGQRQHGPTRWR